MRSRFLSGFAVVFCKPMRASAEKNGGEAAEKRQADFKFSTEMSIKRKCLYAVISQFEFRVQTLGEFEISKIPFILSP